MKRLLAASAIGLGLLLGQLGSSAAQSPDGVIELSGGSVAVGIGYSWGNGTLIFRTARSAEDVMGRGPQPGMGNQHDALAFAGGPGVPA